MAAKPPCQYGDRCYRTNPQHLAQFSHPRDSDKQRTAGTEPAHPPSSASAAAQDKPPDAAKRAASTATDATEDNGSNKRRKKLQSAGRWQWEDGEQSDNEDVGDSRQLYKPLSALNLLSAAERQSYYETLLRSLYSLSFPADLYHFFAFLLDNHRQRDGCKRCTASSLHPSCASSALTFLRPSSSTASSVAVPGLRCCGVYDWLAGRFDGVDLKRVKPWLHSRYFFDLPEMMTVYRAVRPTSGDSKTADDEDEEVEQDEEVKGDEAGWHCGYWRDAPEDDPPFLVSCNNLHPQCTVVGPTIYHAAHRHLLHFRNIAVSSAHGGRSSSSNTSAAAVAEIDATVSRLLAHAVSHDYSVVQANGSPRPPLRDKEYLARHKRVLAPSATTLGFVCPYDPKTEVGFRPLPLTPAALTAMVERMQRCEDEGRPVDYAEWDGVQTLLTLAMDECDPGTVLLFNEEIYCIDRVNGVRVVEGEVSQGMRRAFELMGGREAWRTCTAQQMKHRYRRALSQVAAATRASRK